MSYDPTGIDPAYKITNEDHLVTTDAAFFPTEGVFFEASIILQGKLTGESVWSDMTKHLDFQVGVPYLTVSQGIGKRVSTFIVLVDPGKWDEVRFKEYQYLGGGFLDATLALEILNAEPFDRLDPAIWLGFKGETVSLKAAGIHSDYNQMPLAEILAKQLTLIVDAITNRDIGNPNAVAAIQPFISGSASVATSATGTLNITDMANIDSHTVFDFVEEPVVNGPTLTGKTLISSTQYDVDYDAGTVPGTYTIKAYNSGSESVGTFIFTVS